MQNVLSSEIIDKFVYRKYDSTLPPEEGMGEPKSLLVTTDNKSKLKQGPGRPKKTPTSPTEMIKPPQIEAFSDGNAGNKIVGDEEIALLFSDQKVECATCF